VPPGVPPSLPRWPRMPTGVYLTTRVAVMYWWIEHKYG
jgi:hypothetical protein